MKVKCPKCSTEYNFPENKLKPEGTKVRCTNCSTVFLVRSKSAPDAASETGAPTGSASEPQRQPDDDLSSFFGGAAAQDTKPEPGSEDLDDLFGQGGEDLFESPDEPADDGDDLFSDAGGADDDLFGNDEDLFGSTETGAGGANSAEDDLFGDADDMFEAPAGSENNTAVAKPDPPNSDEDALKSLFDDSDVGDQQTAKPADKPAAKSSGAAAPDFDWDEDDDDDGDEDDELDLDYGQAEFAPAIEEDQAEEVLQQTLVRDNAAGTAKQSNVAVRVLGAVLLVCLVAIGGALALNPDMANIILVDLGVKEPAAPEIYVSPMTPVDQAEPRLVQNRNGFSALIVEGELRNDDSVPHSFVVARIILKNDTGAAVTGESVYAGNILSPLQLKNFPKEELYRLLAVEMGDGLRNFNIGPGETVPYMALFIPAPQEHTALVPEVHVVSSARGER